MYVFTINPVASFKILDHLKRFCPSHASLPCIFENNKCRRLLLVSDSLVGYEVEVVSEESKPELNLRVFTNDISRKVLKKSKRNL